MDMMTRWDWMGWVGKGIGYDILYTVRVKRSADDGGFWCCLTCSKAGVLLLGYGGRLELLEIP